MHVHEKLLRQAVINSILKDSVSWEHRTKDIFKKVAGIYLGLGGDPGCSPKRHLHELGMGYGMSHA